MPAFAARLLDRDFVRAHALEFSYGATGFALFLIFLFATFPYADVLNGVLVPAGLQISEREQNFSFPYGVELDGVKLSDTQPGSRPFFESDRVKVTPSLLAMLTGATGIRANADAYGGEFFISGHRRGDGTAVSFVASDIHLDSYQALSTLGVALGGILSGTGDLYVSQRDLNTGLGKLNFTVSDASLRLGAGMQPLKIGKLTGILNLDHGKLTVQQLESHEGDIQFSARGAILLDPVLAESQAAISFQLKVNRAARARLGILLNLLPHPPNSGPYFLSGTLGALKLS